jgi:hypothetical protein
MEMTAQNGTHGRAILVLALVFTAVTSAQWWLILAYGSPLPFWDEWGAEGLHLYLPWLQGRLHLADLFVAHNEHRLVLTNLLNLSLLELGNRWNPLIQMTVDAALRGACAMIVLRHADVRNPPWNRIAVCFIVIVFLAPFDWQNALWGFQSQHYLTQLLSLLAGAGLVLAQPFSKAWWGGFVALLLAPLATAVAPLAALATGGVLLVYASLGLWSWRNTMPGLVAVAGGLLVALFSRASAPYHEYLHARTAIQFLLVLSNCLAWPNIDLPAAVVFSYLPMLFLVVALFRRTLPDPRAALWPLFLGILAVLTGGAIAYSRGAGLPDAAPISRYQSGLALGAVANLLALALIRINMLSEKLLRTWRLLTVLWLTLFILGLVRLTYANFHVHLPFKEKTDLAQHTNLVAYIATRDPGVLAGKSLFEIGDTSDAEVRTVLDNPVLQPYLPASLQIHPGPATILERVVHWLLFLSPGIFFAALLLLAGTLCGCPRPLFSHQTPVRPSRA